MLFDKIVETGAKFNQDHFILLPKGRLLEMRSEGETSLLLGLCRFQSELLGQFRLISDRASDVSGGRICLTQNAYAAL